LIELSAFMLGSKVNSLCIFFTNSNN